MISTKTIEQLEARRLLTATMATMPMDIDSTYGTGGAAIMDAYQQDQTQSLVIQGDGKVVVAGWSGIVAVNNNQQWEPQSISLIRLNTDGTLDTTFGSSGKVRFASVGVEDQFVPLALAADGSFLVGTGHGVQKISPAGKIGIVMGTARADAIAVQDDGKIVAVDNAFHFTRYNADGSVDTAFGDATTHIASMREGVHNYYQAISRQLVLQPDGKILAVGETNGAGGQFTEFMLTRINTDGSADQDFGIGGYVYTTDPQVHMEGYAVALTSDGKILAGGSGPSNHSIVRYFGDGSIDTSFGDNGFAGSQMVTDLAIDGDGRIVACAANDIRVDRFNSDGSSDITFANYGSAITFPLEAGTAMPSNGRGIKIQSDGKVVVAGDVWNREPPTGTTLTKYQDAADFYVMRLNESVGPAPKPTTMALPQPVVLSPSGTLSVQGTSGDDTITLDVNNGKARLSRNGSVTTYTLSSVKAFSVSGFEGNDAITCTLSIPTTITAGAGNDDIALEQGTVYPGDGADTVVGGDGDGGIDLRELTDKDDDTYTTGSSRDTFVLNGGSDTINSGGGDDYFTASRSSTGMPVINAGDGNDFLEGMNATSVDCGSGNDFVSVDIGQTVNGGDGNDTLLVHHGDSLTGGDGDDTISTIDAPLIDCGAGNDYARSKADITIYGGDGNDNLFNGDGRACMYGGAGNDTMHAGNASDLLSGGGGNDKLFGQGGADRVYGGAGSDRLEGHAGNDRLTGGAGADQITGGRGTDSADNDPLDELFGIEHDLESAA